MLDGSSPIPLYFQLAQILLQNIEQGSYAVGGKIASETDLAKLYGIGRPTVRQATDWLIRKGYLERKRGSGTFVKQLNPVSLDLLSMAGTSRALDSSGVLKPSLSASKIVEIARNDNIPTDVAGERFWFLQRMSSVDDTPLMLESFYLNCESYPGLQSDSAMDSSMDTNDSDVETTGSISAWVKKTTGQLPVKTRQQFSITQANKEQQQLLQWQQALILVKRTLYFDHGLAPIYCEMLCRTDQYEFSQTIGV